MKSHRRGKTRRSRSKHSTRRRDRKRRRRGRKRSGGSPFGSWLASGKKLLHKYESCIPGQRGCPNKGGGPKRQVKDASKLPVPASKPAGATPTVSTSFLNFP